MPILVIDNFMAGIDRRTFGKKQDPSYAWEMYNFDLDQYGRLVKRSGYTRFNSTQLEAGTTVNSLFAYFNQTNNSREIMAVLSNGKLVRVNDSGVGGTPTGVITTTTRDIQAATLRSYFFHTLGTQYLRTFYPNSTFDSGAVGPPTFTPTLTATTGGSLDTNSWYRYRFTYAATTIDGSTPAVAIESSPRSNTKTDTTFDVQLTGSNNAVNIASLAASSEVLVNNTRIYRSFGQPTRAALDTVETYFLAQQNDATTTYPDTTTDGSLGALLDTYDHDRLGIDTLSSTNRLRAICVYNDRIVVSKDIENVIVMSKRLSQDSYLGLVGDAVPYTFPTENIIPVYQGDGDTITAMTVFRGELLIFKRYSTYVLSGATEPTNPPNYQLRKLFGDVGCFADKSLANSGDRLTWLSHRGVYSWDGSQLEFVGDGIQPILQSAFDNSQTNYMEAQGIWVDRYNEYWLAINDNEDLSATPGGYTTATRDRIFKYDFYRRYWRSDVIPSTISSLALVIPQTTSQTPFVLAGSDNESFIYRLLNGNVDTVAGASTQITSRWQSNYLDLASSGRFANDRGGATLGNRIGRKILKFVYIGSVLSSDTTHRPRYSCLLESNNGATTSSATISPSNRTDVLSYKGGVLLPGRDVRLRISLDTQGTFNASTNNTDAATSTFALDFNEYPIR